MRVVVVTTSYPRSDGDPSGHFIRSSARRLAHEGHDVHVIAPGGSLLERPRSENGLTIHRAGGGVLFAWPGAVARAKAAPWRLVGAAPFSIGVRARMRSLGTWDRAVAHWIVPSAWPLLVAPQRTSETCAVAHGGDVRLLLGAPRALREHVIDALLERGVRFAFAAAALLRALVDALAPRLADRLVAASHVEPPAIDVEADPAAVARARVSAALGPGEALWVAASRLVPSKRVDVAVRAAGVAGARLVVVGDGPERRALEELAKAVGANVAFVGALPRHDALAWIGAADLLVHPSAAEAAPSVVREARALGVRVVACDAGDTAFWAASDDGIAIAERTPEGLAASARAALG